MSNYRLSKGIDNFTAFYHQMIGFVHSGSDCQSVQDKKVYRSAVNEDAIWMSGDERQEVAKYSPKKLLDVFERVRGKEFNTSNLQSAVGRNCSPIMALMIASRVAEKIE